MSNNETIEAVVKTLEVKDNEIVLVELPEKYPAQSAINIGEAFDKIIKAAGVKGYVFVIPNTFSISKFSKDNFKAVSIELKLDETFKGIDQQIDNLGTEPQIEDACICGDNCECNKEECKSEEGK